MYLFVLIFAILLLIFSSDILLPDMWTQSIRCLFQSQLTVRSTLGVLSDLSFMICIFLPTFLFFQIFMPLYTH